jgi:hypothetical protein
MEWEILWKAEQRTPIIIAYHQYPTMEVLGVGVMMGRGR